MANQIFIDGTDYTDNTDGLENLTVTYSRDDSGVVNVGITSALTFNRSAFNYLSNKFFTSSSGRDKTAEVKIIDDCCGIEFDLLVRGDALEVCFEDCTISTNAFEQLPDNIAADKLLSQLITVDATRTTPRLRHCVDGGFIQEVLLFIVGIINTIIQGILDIIQSIWGNQAFADTQEALNASAGCGGTVTTAYIRDILEDSLTAVGLTLQSSIFQTGEYSDTVWLDRSQPIDSITDLFLPGNNAIIRPAISSLDTINSFLEKLKITFNADYIIRNGVLIFERIDYFQQYTSSLGDVEQLYADGVAQSPCYTYTDDIRYASALIQFTQDNQDDAGNQAYPNYWDRIEWNDPFNPTRKGVKEVLIPFAPASFVGDEFSGRFLDTFRPKGSLLTSSSAKIRSADKIIVINPLPSGAGLFPIAEVKYVDDGDHRDYNYPLFVNENYTESELYQNFHFIDDPRITPEFLYQLEEFTMLADCDKFRQVVTNRGEVILNTRFGTAYPESIELDFANKTITVSNAKIR